MTLRISASTPHFGRAVFFLRRRTPRQIATHQFDMRVLPFVGMHRPGVRLEFKLPAVATWLPKALGG